MARVRSVFARSKRHITSYGPHLLPFWKSVSFFFLLFWNDQDCDAGWCNAIAKVAPILALAAFTMLHGATLQPKDVYGSVYSKCILWGLTFSAAGDVFLVYKRSYFLIGMAAFAFAHTMYAAAFGFEKSWWKAGVLIALYAIVFWKIVTKNVQGVLVPAMGIYASIIGLMMWRAISRLHDLSDLQTSWTNICSCVGAFVFVVSDSMIAIHKFLVKVPWSNQLIMSTYYLAQLGIAFSVVDCQNKQRGMNLKRLMQTSETLFKISKKEDVDGANERSQAEDQDGSMELSLRTITFGPETFINSPPRTKEEQNKPPVVIHSSSQDSIEETMNTKRMLKQKHSPTSTKSYSVCTKFSKKATKFSSS